MKIQHILFVVGIFTITACQKADSTWRTVTYNSGMEHNLVIAKTNSDRWLMMLKRDVKKNGNSRLGLDNIKRGEYLKTKTARLLGKIDRVKFDLIRERGQGLDPKTHTVKKPLASSGMRKKAKALRQQLNDYTKWLKAEHKDLDIPPLENLGEGDTQSGKSFYEVYFKGTNVVEALTSLTHFQAKVLEQETKVRKKID